MVRHTSVRYFPEKSDEVEGDNLKMSGGYYKKQYSWPKVALLRQLWIVAFIFSILLRFILSPSLVFGDEQGKKDSTTTTPRAAFFTEEEEVASARLQLYDRAGDHIYSTYFLHDGNRVGMLHFAALRDAARRMKAAGKTPNVKLMLDGLTFGSWMDKDIQAATVKAVEEEGVEVRVFNPVNKWNPLDYLNPNTYRRTHEKVVEIDGNYVQTGDRNMQNINFRVQVSDGQRGKGYRSIETVAEDPALAREVGEHYLKQFNGPLAKPMKTSNVTKKQLEQARRELDRYSKLLKTPTFEKLRHVVDLDARMVPVKSIQFIHDDADRNGHKIPGEGSEKAIEGLLLSTATGDVRITSPYFNPSQSLMAVIRAIRGKGLPVRIQTVTEKATDAPMTVRALAQKMRAISNTGTEVFQFMGPDIAHAKLIEVGPDIDKPGSEKRTLVTSHNFNRRSANTDYESGLIIEGDQYAAEVRKFTDGLGKESRTFSNAFTGVAHCLVNTLLRTLTQLPVVRDQI